MSVVADCLQDIASKIQKVSSLSQKTFSVYSEDDLFDKIKLLRLPCVGVVYEGMIADSGDRSRQGMSADIRVAVVLVMDGKSVGNVNNRDSAVNLMDAIRAHIKLTSSETGHKWRFVSENPLGLVNNVLVYVQRWTTHATLTSN